MGLKCDKKAAQVSKSKSMRIFIIIIIILILLYIYNIYIWIIIFCVVVYEISHRERLDHMRRGSNVVLRKKNHAKQ